MLAVAAASIYALRHESLLITSLEIEGNAVTRTEDVESIVNWELNGYYFWLIPRRNALIYPRNRIKESILGEIPRIMEVKTDLLDVYTLEVAVRERLPLALYCRRTDDIISPEDCFFLDESGFIFSRAPSFSGDVYFLYFEEEPMLEPLANQFLPREEFIGLRSFIGGLRDLGVYARAFKKGPEEYELVLPNNARIMWKSGDNLDLIRANLEAFLLDDSIRDEKDFLDKIAYIDLRFNNKVFYMFKN